EPHRCRDPGQGRGRDHRRAAGWDLERVGSRPPPPPDSRGRRLDGRDGRHSQGAGGRDGGTPGEQGPRGRGSDGPAGGGGVRRRRRRLPRRGPRVRPRGHPEPAGARALRPGRLRAREPLSGRGAGDAPVPEDWELRVHGAARGAHRREDHRRSDGDARVLPGGGGPGRDRPRLQLRAGANARPLAEGLQARGGADPVPRSPARRILYPVELPCEGPARHLARVAQSL
ncbi:MAG: Glycosyltransferase, partial [uncultured Rubrobacteraceae bacterium]